MAPGLVALLLAGVTVEVAPNPCTSTVAVAAAVQRRVDVAVQVHLRPEGDDLVLTLQAPNQPPLERPLGLRPGDCPLVPELVAVLTERYVRALPAWTWAPRAPPEAPAGPPRATAPRALGGPRWRVSLGADLGGTLGVPGPTPGLRARGAATARDHPRPGVGAVVELFVAGALVPDQALGEGGQVLTGSPSAGAAAGLAVGPGALTVGLAGGLTLARASGFERASGAATPLLELEVRARLRLLGPLYAGLGLQVPLLLHRYTRAEGGAALTEPPLSLGLFVGFDRTLAFF